MTGATGGAQGLTVAFQVASPPMFIYQTHALFGSYAFCEFEGVKVHNVFQPYSSYYQITQH